MRTVTKTKQIASSAGKRMRPDRDWFHFCRRLAERVARSKAKPMQIRITFDTLLKIALFIYANRLYIVFQPFENVTLNSPPRAVTICSTNSIMVVCIGLLRIQYCWKN